MPMRVLSVVFAPPPCQRLPCQINTEPAGISAAIVSHTASITSLYRITFLPRNVTGVVSALSGAVSAALRYRIIFLELARSEAEQEKGLMFRTAMGADEGMIFPMQPPRSAAFWMKNTVIPLDIIFIGSDHRILNIAANARPYDETPLPSEGAAAGVLELVGGRAAQLGIGPGDRAEW